MECVQLSIEFKPARARPLKALPHHIQRLSMLSLDSLLMLSPRYLPDYLWIRFSCDTVGALLSALEAHCHAGGRLLAIGELVPSHIRRWPRAFVVSSASHVDVLPLCACVVHHGGERSSSASSPLHLQLISL